MIFPINFTDASNESARKKQKLMESSAAEQSPEITQQTMTANPSTSGDPSAAAQGKSQTLHSKPSTATQAKTYASVVKNGSQCTVMDEGNEQRIVTVNGKTFVYKFKNDSQTSITAGEKASDTQDDQQPSTSGVVKQKDGMSSKQQGQDKQAVRNNSSTPKNVARFVGPSTKSSPFSIDEELKRLEKELEIKRAHIENILPETRRSAQATRRNVLPSTNKVKILPSNSKVKSEKVQNDRSLASTSHQQGSSSDKQTARQSLKSLVDKSLEKDRLVSPPGPPRVASTPLSRNTSPQTIQTPGHSKVTSTPVSSTPAGSSSVTSIPVSRNASPQASQTDANSSYGM